MDDFSVPEDCCCLIVESHEGLQRLVHAWLTSLNIKHTQVFDGQHAISACVTYHYDLISIDVDATWSPPITNGLDTARIFRVHGQNKNTPVIAWTGKENMDEVCREAGINHVLRKPLNKIDMMKAISTWAGNTVDADAIPFTPSDVPAVDTVALAPPQTLTSELVQPNSARVLIVEDCSLTQHVMFSLLKKLTNYVSQAFDGEQAILMCQEQQFDIIFMDMRMPKINGLEATHQIRNSGPNMLTPIIAFTSSGTLDDYTVYGVNDMLQKPFTADSLSSLFDKWTPWSRSMNDVTMMLKFDEASSGSNSSPNQKSSAPGPLPRPAPSQFPMMNRPQGGPPPQPSFSAPYSFEQVAEKRGRPRNSPAKDTAQPPKSLLVSSNAPNVSLNVKNNGAVQASTPTFLSPVPPFSHLPLGPHVGMSSATASPPSNGKKKSGTNTMAHTIKEKIRRANIVYSCDSFRKLVPGIKDADKATVFRVSVEYLAFLQSKFPPGELPKCDEEFSAFQEERQTELQGTSKLLAVPRLLSTGDQMAGGGVEVAENEEESE